MDKLSVSVYFAAKGSSFSAKGIFDGNGITVLRGSLVSDTCIKKVICGVERKSVLNSNYRLKKDVYFITPADASLFVCGNNSDGWLDWRDLEGNTLYRYIYEGQDKNLSTIQLKYVASLEEIRDQQWMKKCFKGKAPEAIAQEYSRPINQVVIRLKGLLKKFRDYAAKNSEKKEQKSGFKPKGKQLRAAFSSIKKKIGKDFNKKYYIGDIAVNDDEYAVLKEYTKSLLNRVNSTSGPERDDPILALALVQMGIKRYCEGNYWGKVLKEELNVAPSTSYQSYLGKSFINTLKAHNKHISDEQERVNAILFHTFVTDYYSKGLFELLFKYYSNDLERDINRNTREQMLALMDTLALESEMDEGKRDKFNAQFIKVSSRAYMLRMHTLQAISANQAHSNLRLRRILRLIDTAFWRGTVPKNPKSRITVLFIDWLKDSPAFKDEYALYQSGKIKNRGKKHFSIPYLFADIKNTGFALKLPAQIVKEDKDLYWNITVGGATKSLAVETYPVLTGYKTTEAEIAVPTALLFSEIICMLSDGSNSVRKFVIPASPYRIFDFDGDYSAKLFKIPMVIYTSADYDLVSPALTEKKDLGSITRWAFEFVNGDVLIFPDGKSMTAGESFTDGLSIRNRVENAFCRSGENTIPVYKKIPNLLLTIPKSKIPGTLISVNKKRYKLGECERVEFDAGDSKGNRAFLVSLSAFGSCKENTVNEIYIEVPGALYGKLYSFAYIKNFDLSFDGAPYVFESKGTLLLPNEIKARSNCKLAQKLNDENGFSFEICPEAFKISLTINDEIDIIVEPPILMWSWDQFEWFTESIGDIWHSGFKSHTFIYFRSPERKISLSIDEGFDDDEDEQRLVPGEQFKTESESIYRIDLTRFKTWITRDKIAHNVLLKLGHSSYDFAKVFAKSYIVSCDLTADYDVGALVCSADIIGKGQYFVDISLAGSDAPIVEKGGITNGQLLIDDKLINGDYIVEFFELDESGEGLFDDEEYISIHEFKKRLVNKNDLSGSAIELIGFKKRLHSNLYTYFKDKPTIKLADRTSPLTYIGKAALPELGEITVGVKFVNADDLRHFELTFWSDDEEDFFLYDAEKKILVQDEEPGLKGREKYRRYDVLFADEYIFYGTLSDTNNEEKETK